MIRFTLLLFFTIIQINYSTAQINSEDQSIKFADYYFKLINRNYQFSDLRKTEDSIFIRVCPSSFGRFIDFYEVKCDSGNWVGRKLIIDTSRKTDICIKPKTTWKSIESKISDIDILSLKNQFEVDSSHLEGLFDGVQYFIEIATPTTYKLIHWDNPEFAPVKSAEVKRILAFLNLIEKEFIPCTDKDKRKLKKKNVNRL